MLSVEIDRNLKKKFQLFFRLLQILFIILNCFAVKLVHVLIPLFDNGTH